MSSLPAHLALDNSLGALEIGIEVTILLLGITTVQTYIYFRTFPKDPQFLKFLVIFLWFLDLVHVILVCHSLYLYTVTYFGQPLKLLKAPETTIIAIFFGSLLDRIVQVFFAYRLWKFGRSIILFGILCTISLFILSLTYVAAVLGFSAPTNHAFAEKWGWMFTVAFYSDAAVDSFTAAALCYYLIKEKQTSLRSTSRVLDRLLMYTINTGLVTSLVAIAAAVTFQTMKDNGIWIGIYATLPGWFSNAFLAAVNSRKGLQTLGSTVLSGTAEMREIEFSDIQFSGAKSTHAAQSFSMTSRVEPVVMTPRSET